MTQQKKDVEPSFRKWFWLGIFLTLCNGCWAYHLHTEDQIRKGRQGILGQPSPRMISDTAFFTIDAFLAIQFFLSAYAVYRTGTGRWWLAGILVVLWLIAVFLAGGQSGLNRYRSRSSNGSTPREMRFLMSAQASQKRVYNGNTSHKLDNHNASHDGQ